MERIKQALDKARGENNGGLSTKYKEGPKPDQNITYTETSVVSLHPDSLYEKRVVAIDENDPATAAYKVLRTQVLQRLRVNKWNSLAITSPTEGCGKTLTAINLAICLAREVNHTVLLVDMDLRRPKLHSYFPGIPGLGISDYLLNDVELSGILINPGIERLVILPGHKPFSSSSETLSSPKMVELVEELKSRYPSRIVLFDLPPVLPCDDVIAFAPYVDAALLVIEDGKTQENELKRAVELLDSVNILGTVLNKSSESTVDHLY
ncbi:MAG: CpsD/CapB family tyrosine-protein kinase [Candidatus Polarisedimenticolaceae bacterium]|nr:CpsD/CapB family tyrosine-protein kinase [Candidatus Polarisedimenticolaceae bacterium]